MKLAFAISLVVLSFSQVQAQAAEPIIPVHSSASISNGQLDQPVVFTAPPPPNDIGEPGTRSTLGCGCDDLGDKGRPLIALVPLYGSEESGLVWGKTTASHPTFWFYVPYPRAFPAQFVLQNEADRTLYEGRFSLPGTPGVIGLQLPSTVKPLEIGKRYHWWFLVYYKKGQAPAAFVHGWIGRDKLNAFLKIQLWKATPKQRAALLAPNGFWYDALTASAEIRRTEPRNTAWAELLRSVGLEAIASKPIVKAPGSILTPIHSETP